MYYNIDTSSYKYLITTVLQQSYSQAKNVSQLQRMYN